MYIEQNTELTFYNKESTSIQRLDINDLQGYNFALVSKNESVPLTQAAYQKRESVDGGDETRSRAALSGFFHSHTSHDCLVPSLRPLLSEGPDQHL